MKKFFAILAAAIMLLTLACPVFAEGTGTITVDSTVKDQSYTIYKIADLLDYDAARGAYLYVPVADWVDFFEAYPDAFDFNDEGNIIYTEGAIDDKPAFAKAALEYAEENDIDPVDTKKSAADDADVVFEGLDLGYYLVDTTLGGFCALTTTDPNGEATEKNAKPSIDKEVEEDSLVDNGIDGDEWGKTNDADTFQTINYKTTITVQKGAENYVLHDSMDPGLTYTGITSITVNGAAVAEDNYTVTTNTADGCDFEIAFENDYIATLEPETQIIVAYTAKLNENAVIAGEGNDNETWLDYGEGNHTNHITTTTYTFEFDLVKTDASDTLLDGAEFKLYKQGGTDAYWFLKDEDGYYVVAAGTEGATDTLVVTDGKVNVRGLDSDNYSLDETAAPAGYNEMEGTEDFEIDNANLNATIENDKYTEGGVRIINRTGSLLPGTGGIGTTLFIVLGGLIVLAAGVVLVSKKRMAQVAY